MRSQRRNKQQISYSTYMGKIELSDDYGDPTGDFVPSYDLPKKLFANVSPASGSANMNLFGIGLNYSHVVTTTDMSCPVNEESLVWVDGKKYVVLRVAKSLNSISMAIKEVIGESINNSNR